jgi:hypothetical protein
MMSTVLPTPAPPKRPNNQKDNLLLSTESGRKELNGVIAVKKNKFFYFRIPHAQHLPRIMFKKGLTGTLPKTWEMGFHQLLISVPDP